MQRRDTDQHPRPDPPRGRARRWLRGFRWALLAVLVLLVSGYRHLKRDLRPAFRERHGALAADHLEGSVEAGGQLVEHVTLRSTSGLEVRLSLKRPHEESPARRPVVLLLGGHETGRDAVDLIPDTRGVVLAALDYPLEGPRRIKGIALLPAIPRIRQALVDTPPALQLAADWLLRQEYVDPARLELVGVSLGAPFACVAGALDERFARVWSIHGGAQPRRMLDQGLRSKVPFAPARRLATWLGLLLAHGEALAPEGWVAAIAPRPFLMVNARDDERIPRACVDALYAAAGEPKELVWVPGKHVHPKRDEIVRGLIGMVLERIERSGPVPPIAAAPAGPDGGTQR